LWNELKGSIEPERLRRFAESFPGSTEAFEARERAAYLDQADKAHRELASTFMSQDAFQRAQNEAVHHHNAELLISLADRLRKDASRLFGFIEAWPQHPLLASLKERHQSLLATIKYINSVVPERRAFERAQIEAARKTEFTRKEAARLAAKEAEIAAKEAERVRLEQLAVDEALRREQHERSEAAAKERRQRKSATAAFRMVAEFIWLGVVGGVVWLIYEGFKQGMTFSGFLGVLVLVAIVLWIWIGCWGKPFERLAWAAGVITFYATVGIFLSSQGRI
jgi:F0F1-type ATP synthase assembly protein I